MPWIRAVTAIKVVVARMIPSNVRKLRSLFLRSESRAIRVASQKEALRRNWRALDTAISPGRRTQPAPIVPQPAACSRKSARKQAGGTACPTFELAELVLVAQAVPPAQCSTRRFRHRRRHLLLCESRQRLLAIGDVPHRGRNHGGGPPGVLRGA